MSSDSPSKIHSSVIIHPTAEVSSTAGIDEGTRIWHHAQIREGVVIGQNCIVGKDVYIDFNVVIGNNVKIQNSALLYHGLTVEDGVFIGPRACTTNDQFPRAITSDGRLKLADDWEVGPIAIRYGASIGAGAILLPNVTIGRFALVGAGAVVTHSVADHGLVMGLPARLAGYVCRCGHRLVQMGSEWHCPTCGWLFQPEEVNV
jgi:acetyltransferase-like isoleucine patch superfamily enzyme